MKTILLVEDDFLNRRLSKKILLTSGYEVLEAKNAKETFELLQNTALNLVILDINLGEKQTNGISIGQEIQQNYGLPFLYLTAYDTPDMLKSAVSTKPVAYLTKPFKDIDLLASVEIALRQHSTQPLQAPPFIVVKDEDYNLKLPVDKIDYIESEGNYLSFYVGKKNYKLRSTIKQILQELPENHFIQTHRAYIVNKQKIEKFSSKGLVIGNTIVPISKGYIDVLDKI